MNLVTRWWLKRKLRKAEDLLVVIEGGIRFSVQLIDLLRPWAYPKVTVSWDAFSTDKFIRSRQKTIRFLQRARKDAIKTIEQLRERLK